MAYQAQLTEAAAAFHERMFPGYVSDFLRTDAEFIERFDNFAFDEVIRATEDTLDERTRFMCWLATLLGCQGIDEYRGMLPAALRMGVEPEAVKEIVYQADPRLEKDALTGKFRIKDGLDYALQILQTSLRFDYSRDQENNKIFITSR